MVIDRGVLLDSMPKKIENAKILLLDCDLQVKNPEMDVQAQVNSPDQLKEFAQSDREELDKMIEKVISSGANVVICQKGVDDYIQHELSMQKIMVIRRVAKFDIEQLSTATGASILTSIDSINKESVGIAGKVIEEKSKEGSLTYFRDCENSLAVCILLNASTSHILDEIRRAVTDGLGDVLNCYKENTDC